MPFVNTYSYLRHIRNKEMSRMEERDRIRQERIPSAFIGLGLTSLAIWYVVSVSAPGASVPVGILCLVADSAFAIWMFCQGDPRWESRGRHCRVMATPRQPGWKPMLWISGIVGAVLGLIVTELYTALFK